MIYDILPVNNYKGNNSSTEFEFDFYIENADQLSVYLFDKNNIKYLLKNELDYSINEVQNENGSYITFPLETSSYGILAENEKLSIELNLKAYQLTQYGNSSSLNLSALENSFDYLTRLIQILKRKIDLCLKVEEISESTPEEFIDSLNQTKIVASNSANEAKACMDKAQNYMIEAQNSANNSQASYLNAKTIEESISKFQQLENQITVGLNSKANLNLANSVPDSSFVAKCTSWLMPDISKGVQIASYPYTTPDLGWIIGYTNATTSTYLYMYLDEKPIGAEADDYINIAVPVSKGQVLTASTTSIKQRQLYFYPMKGKA